MSVSATSNVIVFAPCRRGKDKATEGQSCQGRQAEKLSVPEEPRVRLRCVTCRHTWSISNGAEATNL